MMRIDRIGQMRLHRLIKVAVAAWLVLLAACDSDVKPVLTPVAPTSQPTGVATTTPIPIAQDTLTIVPATDTAAAATSGVTPAVDTPTPVASNSGSVGCIAAGPQARHDSIGDPFYPQLGNAGYDAQHYSLD